MGTEKSKELGAQILRLCRNELYSHFPYMDGAFASLSYRWDKEEKTVAVDGEYILYGKDFLINQYSKSPAIVRRGYLHMLLHCIYQHIFPPKEYRWELWNLACDLAVELVIEQAGITALRIPEDNVRKGVFNTLRGHSHYAEGIYRLLIGERIGVSVEELKRAFVFDDHSLWYEDQSGRRQARMKQKWEKILAYTGQNKNQHRHKPGSSRGEEEEEMAIHSPGRYDYKSYLKQFALLREEVELDLESFDYIYYHLGMEEYGNMPLIEPLEYKEVNRLQELVIAIDTSSSCSREVVQRFLQETYSILSDRENFFRKMKVYIIQCDCYIQDVAVIHNEEEWKAYCKNVTIQGRGGTDFRPVFRYVEKLIGQKELKELRALIYFTDGDGIYPREETIYETAFVFLRKTAKMEMVPNWAKTLIVDEKWDKGA